MTPKTKILTFQFAISACILLSIQINPVKSKIESPNFQPSALESFDWHTNKTIVVWNYVQNGTGLFSKLKLELELDCSANYPIKWNITGYINPPEIIKMQPYRREIISGGGGTDQKSQANWLFSLKMFIFFGEGGNGTASSANIYCQSAQDPLIQSSLQVFNQGPKPFIKSGEVISVADTNIIPCAITDPTLMPINLFKQSSNGRMELIANAAYDLYDPVHGFIFPNTVEGKFMCSTSDPNPDSVIVEASITKAEGSTSIGIEFHPKTKMVKAFTKDSIVFKCSTKDKFVEIQLASKHNASDFKLNSLPSNSTYAKIVELTGYTGISGSVECRGQNFGYKYWTWNFQFIDPPQLYLDNFEGEVDCLSDRLDDSVSVSTVRCLNPSHCSYMKHCFENKTLCNFKKQKQFYANKKTRCWIQPLQKGSDCTSVPYSHLNGLAQCTVGGLTRHWEFFVSLDFLKYENWRNADLNELVRMDNVPSVLYTNYTSEFLCVAVAYLFADSLTFEILYENGTSQFVDKSLVSNPEIENKRKIDEFNVVGELKINLTIDTVGIYCHAPWWNSTDTLSVEKRFVTRHLKEPKIQTTKNKETFIVGQPNRRLECHAEGEPMPNYVWSNNGIEIDEKSDFKISTGSKGQSFLEFPTAEKSLSGKYLCLANNTVGKAHFEFNVTIEDEGISLYATTIGIILFILIILALAFLIVFKRYKKAQQLLRSLTENEIDEFFKGRPDLLSATEDRLSIDTLDLLPYDENYEIDINDVDFDSSNILGSGEFSYVVRGFLKSKEKHVAVKVAKPSADVTLFKSLLSEVKIMIYIGKHDNIVALVGVSTRNIQNRSIHIIMEMCDIGSLENYLRKNRRTFNNLIDQSQTINLELLNKESSQVSTLDLIRWAAHIAKGMEYLSYKSIVHADLAARNVLLTTNRVAKISDFGLSKKLYECNNYVKKTKSPLPWRWMAPESLSTLTFSTESDIWSYGVTLWEIFTLGDVPFPNESWNKEFNTRLNTGMRMGKPKLCTLEIYSKIVGCWDEDATLRPPFTILRKYFFELFWSLAPQEKSEMEFDVRSETNRTYVTELDESEEQDGNTPVGLYENVRPDGQPSYANLEPTGLPTYSNVP